MKTTPFLLSALLIPTVTFAQYDVRAVDATTTTVPTRVQAVSSSSESTENKGGNAETTWKVEKGEKDETGTIDDVAAPCPHTCESGECVDDPADCPVILEPVPGALPELPGFDDDDDGEDDCRHRCDDGRCVEDPEECRRCPILCDDGSCVQSREDCPSGDAEPTNAAVPVHMDLEGQTTDDETRAVDMFMKIEGIDGESEEAGKEDPHKDWINLSGVSAEEEEEEQQEKAPADPEQTADDKHDKWIDVLSIDWGQTAASKKRREIVVVGSKLTDESNEEKEERVEKATVKLTQPIANGEHLASFMQALVDSDTNVQQAVVNEDVIALTYRQPAKLFGFIPVHLHQTTEVSVRGWDPVQKEPVEGEKSDPEELGRIKVRLPWWSFLTMNKADLVEGFMEEELSSIGEDAQLANIDLQDKLNYIQNVLLRMADVSQAGYDLLQ